MRTGKALARLRRCAGLSEPLLAAYVISTIISSAGSIFLNILKHCPIMAIMARRSMIILQSCLTAYQKPETQHDTPHSQITLKLSQLALYSPSYTHVLFLMTGMFYLNLKVVNYMGRAKRIWYLSPMRAAKVQASLRIRAVSPEPSLLAHTSSESRGTFRQKAKSLAPLNGWACAVKICHDGMLEDTNSLGAAHMSLIMRKPVFGVFE